MAKRSSTDDMAAETSFDTAIVTHTVLETATGRADASTTYRSKMDETASSTWDSAPTYYSGVISTSTDSEYVPATRISSLPHISTTTVLPVTTDASKSRYKPSGSTTATRTDTRTSDRNTTAPTIPSVPPPPSPTPTRTVVGLAQTCIRGIRPSDCKNSELSCACADNTFMNTFWSANELCLLQRCQTNLERSSFIGYFESECIVAMTAVRVPEAWMIYLASGSGAEITITLTTESGQSTGLVTSSMSLSISPSISPFYSPTSKSGSSPVVVSSNAGSSTPSNTETSTLQSELSATPETSSSYFPPSTNLPSTSQDTSKSPRLRPGEIAGIALAGTAIVALGCVAWLLSRMLWDRSRKKIAPRNVPGTSAVVTDPSKKVLSRKDDTLAELEARAFEGKPVVYEGPSSAPGSSIFPEQTVWTGIEEDEGESIAYELNVTEVEMAREVRFSKASTKKV
ncbi:hypothetical protein K458DRAFT_396574 [Lentithecium fluviatile CBS 122367]|uniref:Uncharacterized protein n=1 Tax=Lentithecium fluviatile CBS 122367 TaxID=1168545 RepID=A0A6G1IFN4_9PLEO|nr:hypothetical protein K458DRAFT_396574 [Lentithecium fluviatile CBS 122367]